MDPSATPPLGATSEVGPLRPVLLHRPGPELRRLTPRNNDQLLFDGVPWVARAQEEHDAFAQALTDRGVDDPQHARTLAAVAIAVLAEAMRRWALESADERPLVDHVEEAITDLQAAAAA